MRTGGVDGRKSVNVWMPQATTAVLPIILSETNPSHLDPVDHVVSLNIGGMQGNLRAAVENEFCLSPHGVGHPVTHPVPRDRNYLHLLGHHALKCQQKLSPR